MSFAALLMGLLIVSIPIIALVAWVAFVHGAVTLMARLASLVCLRFFKKRPPQGLARAAMAVLWCALFVGLPMQVLDAYQVRLYRNAIPAKLGLDQLIFHDERSDIREGCGVAIFRLSDASLADVRRLGIAYFADATQGRDGERYHQYGPWRQGLPAQGPRPDLLRGWHCLDEDGSPALLDEVHQAVERGEAFYTTGSEMDLIVVPRLKVMVFSHDG